MFTLCLDTSVIFIRQEFAMTKTIHRVSTSFAKFVQQTSRKLLHRYTKTLKTVVNKIIRELKPKCTPRDFCPLFAGVLGFDDDVMIDRLC